MTFTDDMLQLGLIIPTVIPNDSAAVVNAVTIVSIDSEYHQNDIDQTLTVQSRVIVEQ